jgi:FkbM family methyltransferase
MIVVDLGCMTHAFSPEDESTERLLERFQPDYYYGFDPHPDTPEHKVTVTEGRPPIDIQRKAAWTHDGMIGLVTPPYVLNPLRTHVSETEEPTEWVECFDLAAWLHDRGPVVLKMDVEGAEFPLLEHIIKRGADAEVSLLLIEWHCNSIEDEEGKGFILSRLRCPWEVWT